MVLTPSPFDACLHAFPMKAWEEFEAKIAGLPQFEPNVIRLRRLYVSAAAECEIDKQGRVLVPNSLREHAMLQKDVLWAGMGQMVELWAREKWNEVRAITADEREHGEPGIPQRRDVHAAAEAGPDDDGTGHQ